MATAENGVSSNNFDQSSPGFTSRQKKRLKERAMLTLFLLALPLHRIGIDSFPLYIPPRTSSCCLSRNNELNGLAFFDRQTRPYTQLFLAASHHKARNKKASKKKKRSAEKTTQTTEVRPANSTAVQKSDDSAPVKNSHYNKFESRLADMKERNSRGETLSQSYCDSILAHCVASNGWDSVLDVLEVMKSQGLQQERSTYRTCLRECHETGNGASAKEILNAMLQAGVEPDPIDVSLVVAAMCRNDKTEPGWWRKALMLLKTSSEEIDVGQSNETIAVEAYDAVLTCMVKERTQWKEALRLLNMMEQGFDPKKKKTIHPTPLLSTYHAVIENCVAASQAEQAVQVLLSMPKKGIQPNVYTFEQVIVALSRRQQWRRALQLLDEMDSLKIPQTAFTYNTVISACAKAREVGTAKNLLFKMKKRGITPNVVSYNSLMSACASTGRWKDALSLLDQCQREPGIDPDIITYTNAIRPCARGRNTKRALALLDVIKKKGLPLDVYCYTAVIDACAKGKMWRKALNLLDEMRQNGIAPSEVTYSAAIAACGNGGQWERALELLYQMREKGMPINVITYNAAITALSKASRFNVKQSSRVHTPKRYRDDGTPDIDEEQLWVRALELLDQMKADDIEPDGFSYSAAISACGSGGRWREALDLIKAMRMGGPRTRPNKIAYTSAISACGRSGEWQHAVDLFNEMKSDGLQPDRVAYNALVSALRVSDKSEEAFEVWEEMCGKKQGNSTARATAAADASMSPDIITLTDVIGSLCRSEGKFGVDIVDQVFSEAVQRGIVLRKGTLDSLWEVDLSGMSFPVARAACRYILRRAVAASQRGEAIRDINLITGVGKVQRPGASSRGENGLQSPSASMNDRTRIATPGTTGLREYVQQVLRQDFSPPLYSTIPRFQQGTVVVNATELKRYIDAQLM